MQHQQQQPQLSALIELNHITFISCSSQVDFGFAKFIKAGTKTWTFAGTPEVSNTL